MKTYKVTDKISSRYEKLSLRHILKSFLNFSKFEPQCSYKLYSYKKVCIPWLVKFKQLQEFSEVKLD